MKKLLIIAQNVDENDDHRGFFVGWLQEFSRAFDEVSVITVSQGEFKLPHNVHVHSLGKEQGASKISQALKFFRLLVRLVPEAQGVFAHASPIFVIAAWPFTFLWRRKLVLWYLHRSNTLKLRVALALCTTLVTADATSLTIKSPKIVSVGHGIDVDFFTPEDDSVWKHRSGIPPLKIVSVGRITPIKDLQTLIRAVTILRTHSFRVHVEIVGRPVMQGDAAYLRELDALRTELGVQDIVHFAGYVPYRLVRDYYLDASVAVGCTPPGGIDKSLLEAMAAGCVVITSNTVMRRYFVPAYADELIFRHGDAAELADRIEKLMDHDLGSIGTDLHNSVRENHDLTRTISKIVALL